MFSYSTNIECKFDSPSWNENQHTQEVPRTRAEDLYLLYLLLPDLTVNPYSLTQEPY